MTILNDSGDGSESSLLNDEFHSLSGANMEVEKIENNLESKEDALTNVNSPRDSMASSNEVFSVPVAKRRIPSRIPAANTRPSSSIPLRVRGQYQAKAPPSSKPARKNSKPSMSPMAANPNALANKHTLEIQFINKNKRYLLMKKEVQEKQRPLIDLHQNLMQIKSKLEQLGKTVRLEDLKLVPFEDYQHPVNEVADQISLEVLMEMKNSMEEIPKTLMDVCKNLLSRRALIVELLESVTKAEIDVSDVSSRIESLKNEGEQLQHSLDAIILEHQTKIKILVENWQKLLTDKKGHSNEQKIQDLEKEVVEKEKLIDESTCIIRDLHKKVEEKRAAHDKAVSELNNVLATLRNEIRKLEHDLEVEKKSCQEIKTKNTANLQSIKTLRQTIIELENGKKLMEVSNFELQKEVRTLQEQMKMKEEMWIQEKEEMNKNLKHQEGILQKLSRDKSHIETKMIHFVWLLICQIF